MSGDIKSFSTDNTRALVALGFTTAPIYWFCTHAFVEQLKNALFNTDRVEKVPLLVEITETVNYRTNVVASCSVMVTQVRPFFDEIRAGSWDVWPNWYVEGDNAAPGLLGSRVRLYCVCMNAVEDMGSALYFGYIQTIEDDETVADGSSLTIIEY